MSGGTGPYQFLFDCNLDGNWDGIVNSSQTTAQYTCPLGGQSTLDITALAWDQTTGAASQVTVHYPAGTSSVPLGKPGQPYPVSP